FLMGTVLLGSILPLQAQPGATLCGRVTLDTENAPVHGASILIVQLKRSTLTDDEGVFEFRNLEPGNYAVVAQFHGVKDKQQMVQLTASETATLDFQLGAKTVATAESI